MTGQHIGTTMLTRRTFIAVTVAGTAALAGCAKPTGETTATNPIAAAEAARPHTGRTVTAALSPGPAEIDLGGTVVRTLAYNHSVPGPLIRANVGDELAITVTNGLDHPSSVHWHGLALRNDMDGAAPATPNIEPSSNFTYRFSSPHPGTYWAHPHTGLDADYGLYLPVVIDDPTESGSHDAEWIVVLDDWTDGIGTSPAQLYDALRPASGAAADSGMPGMEGMPGMSKVPGVGGVGTSALLGGDAGDISYPYYLANGRISTAPTVFTARPGQRVRVRIINAGSDTAFRVALAGHQMTVTHTDGFPVVPTDVDALLVGMGERYDVLVTAGDGVFPLVASAEGKNAVARALLSTGAGTAPGPEFRPPELQRRVGAVEMFTAAPQVVLDSVKTDTTLAAQLSGSMATYDWMINGRPFGDTVPLTVRQAQHATVTFTNTTMMWHPMHLHGHTFQVIKPDGSPGPRKDTVIVLPMQKMTVALVADNPGIWMLHCHNTYHQEAGMMTSLNYTT
ncbi:multicopper oxidase family protein [Mycolicibacterium gilvum]|uniref:Multicopper oxidase, type 2 n=1 Tax=Mycolicibacterium gilvum TaxID=1804 RepID=A0A378SR18_9MYCO|nr:multicopper oxidase family protein [Mycolicibacterium gilvum]MCV7055893.1 multicopper oxidase family protein [Mycolicibacterium gilvum]STZ44356.1 multicopper oxidase, type 2 [Mycolicibacterium gilvum]